MNAPVLFAAAMLAACAPDVAPEVNSGEKAAGAATDGPDARPPRAPAHTRPPAEEPASVPHRAAGAREVLQRYFVLARAGDGAAAAGVWRDAAKGSAFGAELERYGEFETNIAAPRIEGAAGSLYAEISLQLLRRTSAGLDNLADGTAVLRRSNDVPGATAEQRQWRIERITLQPPPVRLTGPE